jgi:hypothetical protein
MERLNEVEGKKQYRVEISNGFAAVEDLDAQVDTPCNTNEKKTYNYWWET